MQEIRENIKLALMCTIMPIALSFLFKRHDMDEIADIVMFSFFIIAMLSLACPKFGIFIYKTLAKIGEFIGKYIAIIALFFVYIFAVLPTGILMKIVKRDRLRLKKPDLKTYWVKYDSKDSDYEYQF